MLIIEFVKIINIKDNKIVINYGALTEKTININNIIYIFKEASEEELKYGIDEIAIAFIEIMNDYEKNEFKTKNIESLLKKYKETIIDRQWMCRSEHNFAKGVSLENIEEYVVKVIEKIKELLKYI